MRQCWPSASSSRSPTSRRQREQLLAQPQPLVEVVDVQQRGVAGLERDQQRARVVEPVRHLERLGAQLLALRLGRTGPTSRARRRTPSRLSPVWRSSASSSSARAVGIVHARLGVAAGVAERGLGERVAVALRRGPARPRRRTSRGPRGRRRAARRRRARAGWRARRPRAGSARRPPRRPARRWPARRRRARSRRPAAPGPRGSGRRARRGWRRRRPRAPRRCGGAGARGGSRSGPRRASRARARARR